MNEITTKRTNPAESVYDHKKDMQLSIQLNRWILKAIGIWPKSTNLSCIRKFVCFLVNVIYTVFISFIIICSALYMVLEVHDTYLMLKLCGALSFSIMSILKYSSLIFRENDIRNGIKHIEKDWMNTRYYGDRIIMIKNAKFGRRLVVICVFFMYSGHIFYYIYLPLSTGKITNDENLTYQPLINPVSKVIVDVRYSPSNEIFFWMQCLSGLLVHSISAGASSLGAVFAMHAYGRLEVLIQWIEHLVDGREDLYDNVDERLAIIVQQHVRILHFISLTDKVLREISMVEIVGCTLVMCLLGYFCITEWETRQPKNYITFIILLISVTFNIFIFCYIGELLAEKCKKVGEVSYMIDWHRLPERKGLGLLLMIAVSNTSIKLTAGSFFELSLSTFGDVVKTSIAYLNMLRTLT